MPGSAKEEEARTRRDVFKAGSTETIVSGPKRIEYREGGTPKEIELQGWGGGKRPQFY